VPAQGQPHRLCYNLLFTAQDLPDGQLIFEAPMRLTPTQISAIREVVRDQCGPQSRVRLFGSRLDDTQRGGDVDLFIELDQPIERPAVLSVQLAALISRRLDGRSVDVVLSAPNLPRSAVHRVAEQQGQEL